MGYILKQGENKLVFQFFIVGLKPEDIFRTKTGGVWREWRGRRDELRSSKKKAAKYCITQRKRNLLFHAALFLLGYQSYRKLNLD